MRQVFLASTVLCGLATLPVLASGSELPRPDLLSFSAVRDAETSSVHLRITAHERAGAKVAILDGFRIVGYSTIGANGVGEFSLVDPSPGQHWLRISAVGKLGARSEAMPVVVPASWTKEASESPSTGELEEPGHTILVDLNQDNIQDRLVVRRSSIAAALGDGHSGFSGLRPLPGDWASLTFSGTSSISDWNEDGFPDLALGAEGGILLCFGDGQGGFQSTRWIEGVTLPSGEVAGDLNGDSHADLLVLRESDRGAAFVGLLGDGQGGLTLASLQPEPERPILSAGTVQAEDRDGDGMIDFIQVGDTSPQRWRKGFDGQFRLDAEQFSVLAPRAARASEPERSANPWGTTYYGQFLPLAGGGTSSPGDGGPALSAQLGNLGDVIQDQAGNIIFADTDNRRIRMVSKSTGIITTIAGGGNASLVDGGLATATSLGNVERIALDNTGHLFFTDQYSYRVWEVDLSTGLLRIVAGTGVYGYSGDGQAATSAKINYPTGIAVDSAGNLYIADSGTHRIRKVNRLTGTIETIAGTGTSGSSGDGAAASAAQLYGPGELRFDSAGNLLIVDAANQRVRMISAVSGFITTVAGGGPLSPSNGVQATSAYLYSIRGLSVDDSGSFYFNTGGTLHKVSPANVLYVMSPCCSSSYGSSTYDGAGNLIVSSYSYSPGARVGVVDLTSPKFALSTNSVDTPGEGGSGTVTVTSDPAGEPWQATSDMPWLQVSPASGTGAATLTYTYQASNTVNTRTGKITIGGQILTVYQAGAKPAFTLGSTSAMLGGQTSSGTVSLTVFPPDALWRVTGNPAWLSVVPSSGVGSVTLTYDVPVNLSTEKRTGAFSVIDYNGYTSSSTQTFTVTQSAAATAALSPSSSSVGAAAGSLTAQLTTTPAGAAWSVTGGAAWLVVTPLTGVGNAALTVVHSGNNTTKSRTATISVGGQTLTITQAGSPAPYSLWPTSWWGQITTIAGGGSSWPADGGPATLSRLNEPNGIVVDSAGNVFFCDTGTAQIRKINAATGFISTEYNSNVGYPSALALGSSGDLYFSNSYQMVYRLRASGGAAEPIAGAGSTLGDGGQAINAQLYGPAGLAFDQAGRLYIADGPGGRVRRVDLSTGIITTVAGTGTHGFSGDGGLATNAQLNGAHGVAFDGAGNLFIAETVNGRIRRVDAATGIISTVAGGGPSSPGDGGPATSAALLNPFEVKLSPAGDLYISSYSVARIHRVDLTTGIIYTVAGTGISADGPDGGSAISTTISKPYRIAFDELGNLYFSDAGVARKIRYVDYVSPRSTLSPDKLTGSATAGSSIIRLTVPASTGAWTLTNNAPSWLSVTPTTGTGDTNLTLSYSANPTTLARTGTFMVRGQLFTLTQPGKPIGPGTLKLDRTHLNFSGLNSSSVSPPQQVVLSFDGASSHWVAQSWNSWLQVSPASGTGPVRLTISINPAFLPSAGLTPGTIAITGGTGPQQGISVKFTRLSTSTAPFGAFDTPTNNAANVAGSIAVTGWAMDDLGVKEVKIYRDRIGTEPAQPNGLVYIGDAVFIPNARTDIEGFNPNLPNNYRAGWGYLMLTNDVYNGGGPRGNGTIRLWAIAKDVEGKTTTLGSKTITLNNANARVPFGAMDQPGQGASVSGTFSNSGWVMTPQPNLMAANPSNIMLYVDGAPVGKLTYGQERPDVAGLFPSYRNSAGPGAGFVLNTTSYSDGMHSIYWVATDEAGNTDGIGSRFFFIENGLFASAANPAPPLRLEESAARAARPRPQRGAVPQVRTAQELDRLVIDLPEGNWTGAHLINGEPRPLPVGSTLDNASGAFYWHLGPGFLGRHELLFTSTDGAVFAVSVNIEPRL